jgi:hypothetical protein
MTSMKIREYSRYDIISKPYLVVGPGEGHLWEPRVKEIASRLSQSGITYYRLFMVFRYDGSCITPWEKTESGFDLNRWNNTYWRRLKILCQTFWEYGIVVELNIFDHWTGYSTSGLNPWRYHPFNPANNTLPNEEKPIRFSEVTDTGMFPQFYKTNVERTWRPQEFYIRKLVSEVGDLGNIVYHPLQEARSAGGPTIVNWYTKVVRLIRSLDDDALFTACVDKPARSIFEGARPLVEIQQVHSLGCDCCWTEDGLRGSIRFLNSRWPATVKFINADGCHQTPHRTEYGPTLLACTIADEMDAGYGTKTDILHYKNGRLVVDEDVLEAFQVCAN